MTCLWNRGIAIVMGILLVVAVGCTPENDKGSTEKKPVDSKSDEGKPADPKPAGEKPAATTTNSGANTDSNGTPVNSGTMAKTAEPKSSDSTPPAESKNEKKMSVSKQPYGKLPDGADVDQYTLTNANGLTVKIINYGAIITSVQVPDRNGKVEEITLHRDSLKDYMEMKDGKPTTPYFGATVGRYANRIAKGHFTLDGKEYTLAINNPPNALHGGLKGFDKVLWSAESVQSPGEAGVVFSYVSPDGDQGYPGKMNVKVTYSLTDKNELKMDYEATTDKDTVVNLTNHTYWNLAGAGNGDVLDHEVMLDADRFLPVDDTLIPLGEVKPVKGTAMDFTTAKKVGKDMAAVEGGYDHCYVLNKKGDEMSLVGRVTEAKSGRVMEVTTTQPAVQFYGGNFLDGTITSDGKTYGKHFGLCLETQHYPDSPNQAAFPTTELKPGETYHETTVYKFDVQK